MSLSNLSISQAIEDARKVGALAVKQIAGVGCLKRTDFAGLRL